MHYVREGSIFEICWFDSYWGEKYQTLISSEDCTSLTILWKNRENGENSINGINIKELFKFSQ